MRRKRPVAAILPGDPKVSEPALPKDADLQQCIESLRCIICDLLVENERLRQLLTADKLLPCEQSMRREKTALFANRNPEDSG